MNIMLISSRAPQNLQGETILIASYIFNKIPHKKLEKTPYEFYKGRRPSNKYLNVWGVSYKGSNTWS